MEIDLRSLSVKELLRLNASTIEELINRGIIRTRNNPVADYAEYLVSTQLNLNLSTNSRKGFDATDQFGVRYQIKSRRYSKTNRSNQLGVIRNLDSNPFDFLIAVVFEWDYSILFAVMIPIGDINQHARFSKHQNGHILIIEGEWVNKYLITEKFV